MDNQLEKQIEYICDNVDDLLLPDRRELLSIILGSFIDRTKVRDKKTGTQIMISDIPKEIIPNLYSFMQQKLNNYTNNFDTTNPVQEKI